MDNLINQYIESNGSKSKSTRTTMISSLKRLAKVLDKDVDKIKVSDLENVEGVMDMLTEKFSLNTVIQTILGIKLVLRNLKGKKAEKLIEKYHEVLNELINERNSNGDKQEKTKSEEDLGENFDWQNIKKLFLDHVKEQDLKDLSFSRLRALLMMGLFVLQPPARLGNYLNMEVRSKPLKNVKKDKNYLFFGEDPKFVFQNYKTAKILGKVELPIKSKVLMDLIMAYLSKHPQHKSKNHKPHEFLVREDGTPISQSAFTQTLKGITKKILGTGISINTLRHAFLTWFQSQNPSLKEKQKIAELVGQTYKQSRMEKYKRVDSDDEQNDVYSFDDE